MDANSTRYGYPMPDMPTPEELESAMKRGNRERSQMFWSISRAIGGWIGRVLRAPAQDARAAAVGAREATA